VLRRLLLAFLAVPLVAGIAHSAPAELPSVARPHLKIGDQSHAQGLVFFLRIETPPGVAAVGTAHAFELTDLVEAQRAEFTLGRGTRAVATSKGLLAAPGRPFNQPGASLKEDFVVYALEASPQGVRPLEAENQAELEKGDRVRMLGIPVSVPQSQDHVFGKLVSVTPDRIEVELDVPYDLRGWGGAPVLLESSKRVIGMLQAHYPQGSTTRVILAPLSAILAALERPLAGGTGQPFAQFASLARKQTAKPARDARIPTAEKPSDVLPHSVTAVNLQLDIEYPPEGAVVGGSACGVFVAGRALAMRGQLHPIYDIGVENLVSKLIERGQIYFQCGEEMTTGRDLELLGDECLFWASDFPHEGIVSMKKAVDEFLERDDIPTAAKRKISYDNPKRLYAL
jgi:hypothetical protein